MERDRVRHAQVRHNLSATEADERRLRDRQRRRDHRFPVSSVEDQENERAKHIKKSYEKDREMIISDDNLGR